MSQQIVYEYARDDFRYPRWLQWLLEKSLSWGAEQLRKRDFPEQRLRLVNSTVSVLGVITLVFGWYFATGLLIGFWIYLDELHLRLFVDRSVAKTRLRHFLDELVIPMGLFIHMLFQGHFMTAVATLIGILGMYLLTNLQMKHDLSQLHLPNLYFLRWDRSGFFFLFIILGAWPGTRSYLWPVLAAWFLPVLTFYDYIWIQIQIMKRGS